MKSLKKLINNKYQPSKEILHQALYFVLNGNYKNCYNYIIDIFETDRIDIDLYYDNGLVFNKSLLNEQIGFLLLTHIYYKLSNHKENFQIYLFNQISDAVHAGGKGLADIQFTDKFGKTKALLHDSEIVHLQDVANLIDKLDLAGAIALLILLAGLTILRIHKVRPRWKVQLGIFVGLLSVIGAVVLIAGPTAVFYQLHVWIFPDNHQWFFYYQESLMSTLMKAPVLFGGIALAIIAGGVLFFALFVLLLRWGLRFRSGVVPA